MKKSLFIILILMMWVTTSCGQKVRRGDFKFKDDVEIEGDVTNSEVNQNTSNVSNLLVNTTGVSGYSFTMNEDTLIVTHEGNTMKFTKTSGSTVDITPPSFLSGEVGTLASDTVNVIFDETIVWTSPDTADYKVTVDLLNAVLKGVYHSGDELHFKLDSSVSANQSVVISFTQPSTNRIADASGNYLASFSTGVTNNVSGATTSELAWHLFENNGNDSANSYDLTATGGATYTAASPIQGTYSGDLDGAGRYFAIPSIPYTSTSTISLWARVWSGGSIRNLFSSLQSDDGIKINYNFTLDRIEVTTGNGATTASAYSTSGLSYVSGTPFHVAVAFDRSSGECFIYFNGVDVTSVSTIRTDYTTTSIARWGLTFSGSGDLFGFIDDGRIYDALGSSTDIGNIYDNPGVSVSIGSGDPPLADDSITVFTNIEFSTTALQRGLTETELTGIYSHLWYLGGELDDECETAGIVEYSSNRWLRSYHDQNTSGVEADGAISNGGSGISWQAWMNAAHDDFSHGYFTYTAKFKAGFVTGSGGKMPGVITYEDYPFSMTLAPMLTTGSSIRNMFKLNATDSVDVMWYIYPHLYANYQYGQTHSRAGSGLPAGMIDRFPMDTEVRLTMRWFSGDTGVKNGFVEWFRDDVLIDQWTGLNFTESSTINFNALAIDTFFGGSGTDYYAPSDTYWDLRDMVMFQYKANQTGVPEYNEPSNPGRVLNQPAEAL